MNGSDMSLQITFLAKLVTAEAAIAGFQFVMNCHHMIVQIKFLATLVVADIAIEGFQFVMNGIDMSLK